MGRMRPLMVPSPPSMEIPPIALTEAAIAGCIMLPTSTIRQNFSSSYVEFTNATVSVFFSNSARINLLVNDSPTNLAAIRGINGGNPWVTLTGHNNLGGIADPSAVLNGAGLFTGSTLSGAGFGLFDVTGPGDASVINFLNANGILDAAGNPTDIALTSSSNNFVLNPADITTGLTGGCSRRHCHLRCLVLSRHCQSAR